MGTWSKILGVLPWYSVEEEYLVRSYWPLLHMTCQIHCWNTFLLLQGNFYLYWQWQMNISHLQRISRSLFRYVQTSVSLQSSINASWQWSWQKQGAAKPLHWPDGSQLTNIDFAAALQTTGVLGGWSLTQKSLPPFCYVFHCLFQLCLR